MRYTIMPPPLHNACDEIHEEVVDEDETLQRASDIVEFTDDVLGRC